MTVAIEAGKSFLKCDECPAKRRDTYDQPEFAKMIAMARSDGWKVDKQAGAWRHVCNHCQVRPGGRLL